MADENLINDVIRRAALNAYAQQHAGTDWNSHVDAASSKEFRTALRTITSAIAPLQAAITDLLGQHHPDGDYCNLCTDAYEDRVTWPCSPVGTILRHLNLTGDELTAIREQFRHVPPAAPRARAHEEAERVWRRGDPAPDPLPDAVSDWCGRRWRWSADRQAWVLSDDVDGMSASWSELVGYAGPVREVPGA